jgi:isopentenyl-diphosphate delta-isomerase
MPTIEERKNRHIRVTLEEEVEAEISTGLEEVHLIHRALPEIDLEEVDTSLELFGRRLEAPLIISALTGGTEEGMRINEVLAEAAEEFGIGIGVGSQRIALEDPSKEATFRVVRERAPDALVIGNLGCPQLSLGWGVEEARRCVEMIQADALAIHMNPLQEAVQVGGETRYRGILGRVREITRELETPVVMKETGCGVSAEDARRIEEAGVEAIDVSGAGGTSWAIVEHHIAREVGDREREALGRALGTWGIPTAISVVEVCRSTSLRVVASGGIRTGLEAAKAIALGADAVGIARPFLLKAVEGLESVRSYVRELVRELRTVMFLVGAQSLEELRGAPLIISGRTAEWLRMRGFNTEEYARRRL